MKCQYEIIVCMNFLNNQISKYNTISIFTEIYIHIQIWPSSTQLVALLLQKRRQAIKSNKEMKQKIIWLFYVVVVFRYFVFVPGELKHVLWRDKLFTKRLWHWLYLPHILHISIVHLNCRVKTTLIYHVFKKYNAITEQI